MKLRLKFWMWVHDRAEDFWHWVWINKVQPLLPSVKYEDTYYMPIARDGEVTFYRSFNRGSKMKLPFQFAQTSETPKEDTASLSGNNHEKDTADDHTPKD